MNEATITNNEQVMFTLNTVKQPYCEVAAPNLAGPNTLAVEHSLDGQNWMPLLDDGTQLTLDASTQSKVFIKRGGFVRVINAAAGSQLIQVAGGSRPIVTSTV